jgi:hypothetical protein
MKNQKASFLTQLIVFIITSFSLLANDVIDVVYTWVDGADPQWQTLLTEYTQKEKGPVAAKAIAKRRFKDHNELKYSLRSIHQFAPWVNHIYIVTFGQRPKWLKETPRISIVDHHDIFTNPKDLPTFNSMAIECNLHHIPGLQEHYLYFNDDVFLGKATTPQDYFSESNTMKIFLSKRELPLGIPDPVESGFFAASKNTGALLNTMFGSTTRYIHAHTPYPTIKSFVASLENQFSHIFTKVLSHRFRSSEDYTITNGIIPYVALYTNHGELISDQGTTLNFGNNPSHDVKIFKKLLRERPRFFCLQDSTDEDNPLSLSLLDSFFNEYFPLPAPWEKKDESDNVENQKSYSSATSTKEGVVH